MSFPGGEKIQFIAFEPNNALLLTDPPVLVPTCHLAEELQYLKENSAESAI